MYFNDEICPSAVTLMGLFLDCFTLALILAEIKSKPTLSPKIIAVLRLLVTKRPSKEKSLNGSVMAPRPVTLTLPGAAFNKPLMSKRFKVPFAVSFKLKSPNAITCSGKTVSSLPIFIKASKSACVVLSSFTSIATSALAYLE